MTSERRDYDKRVDAIDTKVNDLVKTVSVKLDGIVGVVGDIKVGMATLVERVDQQHHNLTSKMQAHFNEDTVQFKAVSRENDVLSKRNDSLESRADATDAKMAGFDLARARGQGAIWMAGVGLTGIGGLIVEGIHLLTGK